MRIVRGNHDVQLTKSQQALQLSNIHKVVNLASTNAESCVQILTARSFKFRHVDVGVASEGSGEMLPAQIVSVDAMRALFEG